ncbi:hypothetical protein SAMN05443667_105111 [Flavobacterium gillisiae]|uniref:Uncharacterized protein n=1 Tax=Flavobacterium gillisiae TaxID=150146 RepID=A0A1H4BWQ9_9FLAO|nr:hypothetical protein SAMN05443667_105111 [Flavobacterium gillisiae]
MKNIVILKNNISLTHKTPNPDLPAGRQVEVELFLILPFLARLKKRERIAGNSSKKKQLLSSNYNQKKRSFWTMYSHWSQKLFFQIKWCISYASKVILLTANSAIASLAAVWNAT